MLIASFFVQIWWNGFIQETQEKISQLEKSSEKSKSSYTATIKKLKLDLEARSLQIAALEQEVSNLHGENAVLSKNVSERDSMITQHTGTIKLREQDIASLEAHVQEISDKAKMDQADLYFAQAQALETAAVRTKFAPRKKKETKREALELYKLSLSLGKEEAQAKINQLEKDLS
jgi:chromosome segregation ATPase